MAKDTPDRNNDIFSYTPLRISMELERSRVRDLILNGKKVTSPGQKPVAEEVYLEECSVLPGDFLANIDFDSMLPADFKVYYPHGTTCCLAVFPFNDGFNGQRNLTAEKWDNFVHAPLPNYLRALMIQPNRLTQGFADIPCPYYDFFPQILTRDVADGGTSFKVDYKREDGKDDREWFLWMCNRALNNLRRFFGQKPVPDKKGAQLRSVK